MSTEEMLAEREDYKYGFRTEIESESFPKGLDENCRAGYFPKEKRAAISP